jgi:hypothetical protein
LSRQRASSSASKNGRFGLERAGHVFTSTPPAEGREQRKQLKIGEIGGTFM